MAQKPRNYPNIPQPIPGSLESVVAASNAIKRWIETHSGMSGPVSSHAVTFGDVSPRLLSFPGTQHVPPGTSSPPLSPLVGAPGPGGQPNPGGGTGGGGTGGGGTPVITLPPSLVGLTQPEVLARISLNVVGN